MNEFSISNKSAVSKILVTLLLVLTALGPAQSKDAKKPNIIFILVDDMGYGDLGSYGQTHIKTPHLDRMAKNGLLFRNFYAGSTVCAPSRCALMTGKHTGTAYIRGNGYAGGDDIPLRKEEQTLAEVLKPVGYRTGLFGKWGLGKYGTEGSPEIQGWDEFYGVIGQVAAHYQRPQQLSQLKNGVISDVAVPSGTYANEAFFRESPRLYQGKPKGAVLHVPLTHCPACGVATT
jgi:phosphoglycerol transferase MdoB-like AlkP superfamily enzyme